METDRMTETAPPTDTTEAPESTVTAEANETAVVDTSPAVSAEPATDTSAHATNGAAALDDGAGPALDPLTQAQVEAVPSGESEGGGAAATEAEAVAEADEATPEADDAMPEADASARAVAGPRTVGRFIADALRAAGVRHAFTVPGESFLGLLDGLTEAGIRVVATRHEGGAAFMAEAHGQLTGRPAACLATRAVGAANLAIGIHTARQNSTPMFALVGQVERRFLGREAFQEIDQASTLGGLARYAAEIRDAADTPAVVGAAITAALGGRPGPALISIPEDILDETLPAGTTLETARPPSPRAEPHEVRSVLHFLASAERPVILAGGGVLRARTSSDLIRLAELLDVPVIAGWRRGDVISNDHPLYLGMAGFGAPAVVRERLERADALLVLGCRLSEITSFGYRVPAGGQRWALIDIDPIAARDDLAKPVISVRSDARVFVRAAVTRLHGAVIEASVVDARRVANAADRSAWEAATAVNDDAWKGPGVHPGHTVATIRRVLPDDAIITTDAGNFGLWVARHFRFRRPGTFLGPTSGAMGYGLPAAIAAALVHRDRMVVAIAGDGGFAMTMAELETAVREKARLVVVVFDNERYGTIRMHQDRREAKKSIATDLGPVDFAAIARACGARGVRVDKDADFEAALRQALAVDRPTVIQVALDRAWVSPDQLPT
jgi:acetolactate synthase-1/2/3 large subunit